MVIFFVIFFGKIEIIPRLLNYPALERHRERQRGDPVSDILDRLPRRLQSFDSSQ